MESVVDMVLKKVNVPTKKEIESLSASINQLSERIENLEKIKNFIETPKAEQVSSEKETPEAETAKEEEKGSTEHLA